MKTKRKAALWRLQQFYKKVFTPKVGFIILGASSTIWFLIRVIPKPQRATYPCMQAAAPFMSGIVVYLLSLWGSVSAYRQTKKHLRRASYALAGMFLIVTVSFAAMFFAQNGLPVFANSNENMLQANMPVGIERGLLPGRVSWVFNPGVAKFDGATGSWWDDSNTLQKETDKMMRAAVMDITAEPSETKAWNALFSHFNLNKNSKNVGYTTGQKIAIKINQNNAGSHNNTKNINASPQLILSLLKSIIDEGKVPQNCITVFDNSRFITNNIYDKCHAVFPDVIFVDNVGGNGRVKSTYVENSVRWSGTNKSIFTGIAKCAAEADYLINMAILKGHSGQGVTLCAKNWFGATNIHSDYRLNTNAHDNFNPDKSGNDKYMTFVDFMGHEQLGEKTMLFLIDGIYAQNSVSGVPSLKWQKEPFNNRWPSSLFASQDGVAIDAVGLDFLRSEWPNMPDLNYSEKYLIEAAQANNPPSATFYDPEKDGIKCRSLGVMETWNSYEKKQYSRNLGKNFGIELKFVDLSAATKTNNLKKELKIYPNPAQNELTIINSEPDAQILIYDLQGKIQLRSNLIDNKLNISHLQEGLYLLQIEGSDESSVVKFIKN